MNEMHKLVTAFSLASLLAMFAGCNPAAPPAASSPSPEGAPYIMAAEPAGTKGVREVRADAKDADEVMMIGRIGGDTNPWIEGQAAFLIVDRSLKPCNEKEDDACPTPWDYCCDTDTLPAHKALIKFVDSSGKTVATDARKLLGVKELQTVVVHGKAKRDDVGNLTVLADGIFVRK